jgi:sulfocyanin
MYSRIGKTREAVEIRSSGRLVTLTVAVGVVMIPFLQPNGGPAPYSKAGQKSQDPSWMTTDASSKTVEFKIEAAKSEANAGLNFNGYAEGGMTLVVPVGWKVKVDFSNKSSSVPHSLVIAGVQKSPPIDVGAKQAAFPGAFTNSPTSGTLAGKTLSFEFSADKAGKYWLICGVPGHAVQGMWDYLEISRSANSPHVVVAGGS